MDLGFKGDQFTWSIKYNDITFTKEQLEFYNLMDFNFRGDQFTWNIKYDEFTFTKE